MPWLSELILSKQAGKEEVSLVFISEMEHLARGIPGNMTNAELHYIKTHPELLDKTRFYREGQVVPNPFSV